ncbi:MAG: VanZ family protein [Paracoccaceae bacterium]
MAAAAAPYRLRRTDGGTEWRRRELFRSSIQTIPPARPVRALWLVSTIVIAVLIAVLTLSPNPHLPRNDIHLDKLAHMAAFFGLVFPTAALWPRVTAWIGLAAVLYGGAIEVIQPYTGRSAEFADLLADGIGVGLGIVSAPRCAG